MSLTTVLQLIKLLASLISYFQSRGWIEQGRKEEREAVMGEIYASLSRALKLEKEIDNASDKEIDAMFESRGWYR
jgi:hypothetical protein